MDGDTHLVHSQDLDTRPDIRPADPTDEHLLARVSCTLGALADLIRENRHAGLRILSRKGEAAGAAQHVLTLAAVAARHTIATGSLDDAVRPLLVADTPNALSTAFETARSVRSASTAPSASPPWPAR